MNAVQELLLPAARRKIDAFPPLRNTGFPVINYLHDEMLACLENGLDQAAIMTANVLLEASLKLMLILEAIFRGEPVPKVQSRYCRMTLAQLIDAGKADRIIPEDFAQTIHSYRRNARNFFQHGNTPIFDTATAADQDVGMLLGALVLGEAIALISKTRAESLAAVEFVDRIVRNTINWNTYQKVIGIPLQMRANGKELSFGGKSVPQLLAPARDLIGPPTGIKDGWMALA